MTPVATALLCLASFLLGGLVMLAICWRHAVEIAESNRDWTSEYGPPVTPAQRRTHGE